jgi:hypothetical protein
MLPDESDVYRWRMTLDRVVELGCAFGLGVMAHVAWEWLR